MLNINNIQREKDYNAYLYKCCHDLCAIFINVITVFCSKNRNKNAKFGRFDRNDEIAFF